MSFDEIAEHFCSNVAECNEDLYKKMSRVQSTRYLGVTLDSNLRWNLHKKKMCLRSTNFINLKISYL